MTKQISQRTYNPLKTIETFRRIKEGGIQPRRIDSNLSSPDYPKLLRCILRQPADRATLSLSDPLVRQTGQT